MNNNLHHYFNSFTPQFSLGHMHYNLRNPVRQLPMIKNEFPKQSLRYKLIATLNETPDSVLAEVQNLSQKQFIDRARQGILAQYSDTCAIHNSYVCKTICNHLQLLYYNLYIVYICLYCVKIIMVIHMLFMNVVSVRLH